MPTVRVLGGTGRAPTALSAYDAALAATNVHDYNLVGVSSVIPPDADVEVCDAAPDLGPVGGRLLVVEAAATVAGDGPVSAALGWTRADGGADAEAGAGVVYEAADAAGPDAVTSEVRRGLVAARDIRDWTATVEDTVVASVPAGGPVDVSVGDDGTTDARGRGSGTSDAGGTVDSDGTADSDDAPDRYTAAVALATYGSAKAVD